MRAMKALSANYFLKAFLQTFPIAYYTCLGHKNFTFQLPGKCEKETMMMAWTQRIKQICNKYVANISETAKRRKP